MANMIQSDFSGGEVTPRISNKIGTERHFKSLGKMQNWMVTPQSSAMARQGTQWADYSLNNDRYKKIFTFPATKPALNDLVVEIDSNGLTGAQHEGNVYIWDGLVRTNVSLDTPEIFGDLATLRSEWDVTTSTLILASRVHLPYQIHYDGAVFTMLPLYEVANIPVEWSAVHGYPNAITFFQNRLWFAGNNGFPNNLWATKVGDIRIITGTDTLNFKPLLEGYVQWILSSSKRLSIGTSISEYSLDSADNAGITELNARIQRTSNHGSNSVQAIAINEQVVFCSIAGAKLLATNYVRDEDNWLANEISNPAQHFFRRPFHSMKKIVNSPNPDSSVFVLRNDGKVAVCTYDRKAQVNAWSLLDFGAQVIDITAIKHARGNHVYVIVDRTNTDGTTPRVMSMEVLKPMREFWFRADSYIAATVVTNEDGNFATGLGRFEGQVVDVASINGSLALKATVAGGQVPISFPVAGLPVYAGLHIENAIETLKPTMGQIKDALVGSVISLSNVVVVGFDSVPPVVHDQKANDVRTSDNMGIRMLDYGYASLRREDLRNVEYEAKYDDYGFENKGTLILTSAEPFMCEVTGISIQVSSNRI